MPFETSSARQFPKRNESCRIRYMHPHQPLPFIHTFRVISPTRACQESQLSMTSGSPPLPSPKRPNYLYGRPLTLPESSSSCNSSTVKTNLPLPIPSDDMTTEESEDGSFLPPPPPIAPAAPLHHAHYIHHSHFQQDVGLPHYKLDGLRQHPKLPTIYRQANHSQPTK